MKDYISIIDELSVGNAAGVQGGFSHSYAEAGGARVILFRDGEKNLLVAAGTGPLFDELSGETAGNGKICPGSHENRIVLQRYFSFLVPSAAGRDRASIGLGDRLGRATPGHIRAVKGRDIFPVFAQQSIRELTLTGRTYEDVLDDVVYAVFREGYRGGFGADGDHLKTEADIAMSLSLGFTMITLDCSEKIDNTVQALPDNEICRLFAELPAKTRSQYQSYSEKKI
ncbi:MAG: tagaturonate epimerase family protein, partial [Spirochaetota bacterium]